MTRHGMARGGAGRSSSYHSIILSYYHVIIFFYHHMIILSSNHNTKWLKSFSVPSLGFRHILSRLPLLQGSLPKNKLTTGNNFLRRICQRRSNLRSSSKTPVCWKKVDPQNFLPKFFSVVEKWNVPNHPKRVFPKFRADPGFIWGVNGRSKFQKKC